MPPPQPYPEWNDWAAYQFDQAVLFVGMTIENAIHERVPTGDPKKHETRPKYTLTQILEPDFKLESPREAQRGNAFAGFVEELKGRIGQPGNHGKLWQYVGPQPEQAQ